MAMQSTHTLVSDVLTRTNGDVQDIAQHLATQPVHVRARFVERCASIISAIAEHDATPEGWRVVD